MSCCRNDSRRGTAAAAMIVAIMLAALASAVVAAEPAVESGNAQGGAAESRTLDDAELALLGGGLRIPRCWLMMGGSCAVGAAASALLLGPAGALSGCAGGAALTGISALLSGGC